MRMFIFLIILIVPVLSQAKAYQRFCFESNDEAGLAFSKLVYFKTAHDMFELDEKCVDVYTIERRTDFFKKFVNIKFPQAVVALSNVKSPSKKNCKLEVEQVSKSKTNNKKVSATKRLYFGDSDSASESRSVTSITLQPNIPGTISVNKDIVTLTCKPSGNGYDINISVGSAKSTLQSSLFLTKGQSTEIGSIIKNLKDQGHSINAPNSIEFNKSKDAEITKIYLKSRE